MNQLLTVDEMNANRARIERQLAAAEQLQRIALRKHS